MVKRAKAGPYSFTFPAGFPSLACLGTGWLDKAGGSPKKGTGWDWLPGAGADRVSLLSGVCLPGFSCASTW